MPTLTPHSRNNFLFYHIEELSLCALCKTAVKIFRYIIHTTRLAHDEKFHPVYNITSTVHNATCPKSPIYYVKCLIHMNGE
jgi:hypothetical protein